MAHAKPKLTRLSVNLKPGKPSYITLTSADNDFTSSTRVLTVQDTDHSLEWDAEVVKQKAGELRIRLNAKASSVPLVKDGKRIKADPPDAGSLTVTITAPVKPVDAVPVDYVDDTPP